jgi:hypothetical protein
MRRDGRKSAAENAVVVPGTFGKRPQPPASLTPRQAEIWREVVGSEDPKFFASGASRALLSDYCAHREAAEKINVAVNAFEAEWLSEHDGVKHYQTLLNLRGSETRAAAMLATKLRMTNQSRYTPQVAATIGKYAAAKGPRPWEAGE